MQPALGRRSLLTAGGLVLGASSLGLTAPATAAPVDRRNHGQAVPPGVFTLGVASGDPLPDGVVIWTRLAPDPLALDGTSGMPATDYEVRWEVAEDARFRRVVRRGIALAAVAGGHAVHAEIHGLRPDRVYWYRFRAGSQISPVGRTRTAPAPGTRLSSLAFAFASCQAYYEGYFTAYDHMAAEDLDLVVHLGDYIYEYASAGTIGRAHVPAVETYSLSDYRIRYAQYKTDPSLQAAHAAAPWVVSPDDHDVENNWSREGSEPDQEPDQDPAVFTQRLAAAYQAYYENMPLRRANAAHGPEMQVYRRLAFGDLLQLNVLDTRRYRDRQLTAAENDAHRWDPERQMLGPEQESWLLDGLGRSRARWNVLGNQIFAMEADHTAGEGVRYGSDSWDGYAAARQRLFDGVLERGVDNFVMVTGDAHRSTAADLKQNFADQSSATVGVELLGTSISSGRDGTDRDALGVTWLAENPHMKFHNAQRGYQVVHLDRSSLRCDYKVLPYVTRAGAPVSTRASIHVESGRPGIAQVEGA